jgi:hypothetical protein
MDQRLVAMTSDWNAAAALFLDELQYLTGRELAALLVACHASAQRCLAFKFNCAGLPQMDAIAGNAKSYAERLFDSPRIRHWSPAPPMALSFIQQSRRV